MTFRHLIGGLSLLAGATFLTLLGRGDVSTEAVDEPAGSADTLSYRLRLGSHVYHHYCESCHGTEGKGDGLNAFNLDPKPRDLTSVEFQRSRTDAQLAELIAKGGADAGLSATMPPWGRTLSSRESAAVLAYIRSLASVRR